jgi:hypothetical protein
MDLKANIKKILREQINQELTQELSDEIVDFVKNFLFEGFLPRMDVSAQYGVKGNFLTGTKIVVAIDVYVDLERFLMDDISSKYIKDISSLDSMFDEISLRRKIESFLGLNDNSVYVVIGIDYYNEEKIYDEIDKLKSLIDKKLSLELDKSKIDDLNINVHLSKSSEDYVSIQLEVWVEDDIPFNDGVLSFENVVYDIIINGDFPYLKKVIEYADISFWYD